MKTPAILFVLVITGSSASAEPLAHRAVELSNAFLKHHLPVLTCDLVGLRIDLPHATAKLRVGGGDVRFAQLRISGDINVVDGAAQIHARVALGVAGQGLDFRLPEIDVQQTGARDHVDKPQRGFELVMPLARESF